MCSSVARKRASARSRTAKGAQTVLEAGTPELRERHGRPAAPGLPDPLEIDLDLDGVFRRAPRTTSSDKRHGAV